MRFGIIVAAIVLIALGGCKREERGTTSRSQIINAVTDQTGQHPGTAAVGGPTRVTCISAGSDISNPQPRPSCFITAPGFSGNLAPLTARLVRAVRAQSH